MGIRDDVIYKTGST